jgi:hypothetical protein
LKKSIIALVLLVIVVSLYAQEKHTIICPDYRTNLTSEGSMLLVNAEPLHELPKVFYNGLTNEIGLPSVPVFRFFIQLPETVIPEISVSYKNSKRTKLSFAVYPLQPPWSKSGEKPPFTMDQNFYSNGDSYPEIRAKIEDSGTIRGVRTGILSIYPVSYSPQDNILTEYQGITIEYNAKLSNIDSRLNSRVFTQLLNGMIYSPTHSLIEPFAQPEALYLIIAPDDFLPSLAPLKTELTNWGYRVKIAALSETGSDVISITDYIRTAYTTWSVPPTFIMFAGSNTLVPAPVAGSGWRSHPSDLLYVCTDGVDFLPDILTGRITAENIEQLDNAIRKILPYYRFSFDDRHFFRKIAFAACGDDGRPEFVEATHQYAMDEYFHAPSFDADSIYARLGGTTEGVVSSINDGVFLINYSGHCGSTGWSNPVLEFEQLDLLSNHIHPLMIGNCCQSGKFDTDCFAHRVITMPLGASAYIGASNNTYWNEDDVWERRVYDGVFREGYSHVSALIYKGNLEVMLSGSTSAEYYFQIYHAFGDPAMSFYFGEPESLYADLSSMPRLSSGLSEYEITVSSDSSSLLLKW